MTNKKQFWQRWLPYTAFFGIFTAHAFFLRQQAAVPAEGWADVGVGHGGLWGFDYYVQAQDYYMGLSYALGAAFAVWALVKYLTFRQASLAAGAAGSVTLVGVLMGAGCFMIGCCGSPMLGVYAGILALRRLALANH